MKLSYRIPGNRSEMVPVKEWLGRSFGKRVTFTERRYLGWKPNSASGYLLHIIVADEDAEAQMLIQLKLGIPCNNVQ